MKRFRVITLLEPELCLSCRFSEFVKVRNERMIRCKRKDCDNWGEKQESIDPKEVEFKCES